jgi:hypothetical protein
MIVTHEAVHDVYKKADFNVRLHLYLQFPELRNDFIDIDLKESEAGFQTTTGRSSKGCKSCGGFIRRSFACFFLNGLAGL